MEESKKFKKTIAKTIAKSNTADYFSVSMAQALVLYAEHNQEFKAVLTKLAEGIKKESQALDKIKINKSTAVLMPGDQTTAVRRVEYLVKGIESNSILGAKEAAQILQSYVADRPLTVPKNLIIGFVGVAIIGPTLGLIDSKKVMVAIVNKNIKNKDSLKTASQITAASHSVMKQALAMADGNIRELDPDMADWFFGEKHIAYYKARDKKILEIEKELRILGIPYALEYAEDKPAVLAISPAVSSDYSELYWDLERIDK